ncbi:MAG: HAD family hydrolase [Actinomycetes bacterium]
MGGTRHTGLAALVVDWGGVLTTALEDATREWCARDDIDFDGYLAAVRTWLGPAYAAEARLNPVHALERGEMHVQHFEEQLAGRLRHRDGSAVSPAGLLERMFACFAQVPAMNDVVRRARGAGLRTALLSNSWGNTYPREAWDSLFDVVVISDEVGMRKPEPEIFHLVAERLGVAPARCVFVDDVAVNVRAAGGVGMVGVHHVDQDTTVAELEVLFDVPLRA